jgi:Mn-dependent DtxR family transcriptional regulator
VYKKRGDKKMREKVIAIGVMVMLVMTFTPVSAAQEDVPPYHGRFGPDSPLYGLKIAFENIDEAVSRSADAKLDKQVAHAEERIAEAKAMIEKGKLEAAEKAMERYTAKAAAINGTATKPDVTEEGLQHARQMFRKHETVLHGLIGDPNMPEKAKSALQRALGNSKAVGMVLSDNVLKIQIRYAEKKVAEAKAMMEKGDLEAAKEAMELYMAKMKDINETMDKATLTEEGLQHARLMFRKHETVLHGLIDDPNMPEQYKPALRRVLNNSRTAEETLNRVIGKMRPEEVPIEERPDEPPAKERPDEPPAKERPRAAPAEQ